MKVITCFSYKGGAARTTAAANIATALSSMNGGVGSIETPLRRKVALIDLDVFSAGMHRVFEIRNDDIRDFNPFIQDYLREQIPPDVYVDRGGIKFQDDYMMQFRLARSAADNCHPGLTLFPAKPDPLIRFVVQKQHDNLLFELMMELESKDRSFDYVILDGESGTRQMADIALRLADVVLVFFRLTWQHIDGTLNFAKDFLHHKPPKEFYLIPTCVPLVAETDNVYQTDAPGLVELRELTERIPEDSDLNKFARANSGEREAGHFWSDIAGPGKQICVHDSLRLKGEERIIVFEDDPKDGVDPAAMDYYKIAADINRLHDPTT